MLMAQRHGHQHDFAAFRGGAQLATDSSSMLVDHLTTTRPEGSRAEPGDSVSALGQKRPVSSVSGLGDSGGRKKSLRRGKWTPEEEEYVQKVIDCFHAGILPLEPGTTLRAHLAERLSCDPMRITKKFSGLSIIGKCIFHPAAAMGAEQRAEAMQELERLEAIWQRRMTEDHLKEQAFQRAVPWPPDGCAVRTVGLRNTRKQVLEWVRRSREMLALGNTVEVTVLDTLIEEGQGILEHGISMGPPRSMERQSSGGLSQSGDESAPSAGWKEQRPPPQQLPPEAAAAAESASARSSRLLALLSTVRELGPESPRKATAEDDGAEGLLMLLSKQDEGEGDRNSSNNNQVNKQQHG